MGRYIIAWGLDFLTKKPFTQVYYVGKATDKQARYWISPTAKEVLFIEANTWEAARVITHKWM